VTHGETVRARILDTGLAMWRDRETVSARGIGQRLGVTHSAVLYHYGSSRALKDAIAAHAVRSGDGAVIADLIVSGHAAIADMPAADRAGWLSRAAG
jgi:AcrR family transcriptional regulator